MTEASALRFYADSGLLRPAEVDPASGYRCYSADQVARATALRRTSLIASVIAKVEGADPARAAFLAVRHDTGETRTGDVNHLGKKYTESEADPRDIVADQVAAFPEGLAQVVTEVIAEYEAKESPEAVCARDADKLECMLQGIEYRAQGYENAQRWIDNSRGRIVTKAGQALADAVLKTGSLDWLRAALGETQR
ncbi:HD domain-containing protein [Streptomyces sp. TRM70350]|uniref:HD domain-containing protein n=1 Tax=Streptomyces sp. TRM70350 TaxID=2856165 RepID=UPI001C48909B|nr:HD domain-containing protein [Streptomyces sp. TRM70350]MBV7698056.1 HD domain-containing protein [Streptomyces sp. TRM70350]